MADDTTAALIAQLDVKFDTLATNMKKAMAVFDNGGRAIEKRQAEIKKNLSNWAFDFTGLSGLNKALVGLTGAAVVGGLTDLVKHGLDAASAIGDTAVQAGVGVEKLQQLRFAASQSGASFGDLDEGLTTLNRNFGEFVNTGAGRAAAAFKQLGIDKLINTGQVRDASQAFDAITVAIAKVGNESQKSSLLAKLFGQEAGPKLLQLMDQGAAGIARLEQQATSLGIVLSSQTVEGAKEANDKLDALFSVMKAEGVAAVSSLAPEIAQLADNITKGLPDLVIWVEKWAQWFGLIKLSPVDSLKAQLQDAQADVDKLTQQKADNTGFWKSLFGISNSDLDALIGGAKSKVSEIQKRLATTPESGRYSGSYELAPVAPALKVAQTPAQLAALQRQKELLAQTGVDAATASAALIAAQDQTNVQLLKGSSDYYAAVQKQINDEYQAKVTTAEAEAAKQKATLERQGTDWKGYADGVANINQALADKIAAAAEEQKQKLDDVGLSGLIRDALISGNEQIKSYQDQTDALGLTVGQLAKEAYLQGVINDARAKGITLTREDVAANPDLMSKASAIDAMATAADKANQNYQTQVELTDTLRNGLDDVAAAGTQGFSSMKDAAAQFLQTLAQTIIKLYVMQPLLNSLFGNSGTSGGGLLGGILSGATDIFGNINPVTVTPQIAIPGFATGTNFAPGGMAIVGERGPELVNLPRGSQVVPNIPPLRAAPASQSGQVLKFDLRGAVVTQDLLKQMQDLANASAVGAAQRGLATYDRHVLPARVRTLTNDPRRSY